LRERGLSVRFEAIVEPTNALIDGVGATTPLSPFNSSTFAAAARAWGAHPCLLGLYTDTTALGGALALLSGDSWLRSLTIPTAPSVRERDLFWQGVLDFCRHSNVGELHVETFSCRDATPPDFALTSFSDASATRSFRPAVKSRRERFEYWLALPDGGASALSENHRRALQRARKAGLFVSRSTSTHGVAAHVLAMGASAARRRQRGEDLATPDNTTKHRALLQHGAAELFQAGTDGDVIASILVLRARTCAYYHSAGATATGMRSGASAFLVVEAAKLLAADGLRWFNLGGAAADASGLRRFKAGFGAQEVALQSTSYWLLPAHHRTLRRFARAATTGPYRLRSALLALRRSLR
jgi:hypothetical protein